jgi:Tol biopolymer transport system component
MKIRRWLILFAAAAMVATAQPNRSAEAALGAARRMEEAEGNFSGAIEAYKKFLAQYGKDRTLAAKALVRMGQCYEKLGDNEARKAYERVVREFSDQKDAVAEARRHLGGNGGSQTGVTAQFVMSANGYAPGRAVSRDGRYGASVSLRPVEARTDRIVNIHDLVTGEVRPVVSSDPAVADLSGALISPDGTAVAYARNPVKGPAEVWIAASGSAPRRLFTGGAPRAWSPDGKYLLAVAAAEGDKPARKLLLPAEGGDPVVVGTGRFPDARFSPDGSRFAFLKPRASGGDKYDIYAQPTKGGAEIALVENFGTVSSPVFSRDGKHLLFISDRTGTEDLWSIPLVDGAAGGPPVLVKQQVSQLIGMTDAGDCYYRVGYVAFTLYVTGFDSQSGKVTTRPTAITDRNLNLGGTWSPDGEYLAYTSQVPVASSFEMKLVVRSTKTGQERTMTAKELLQDDLPYWWQPQWFPDSHSLLLGTMNGKLHRLDVRTFEVRPVLGGESLYGSTGLWANGMRRAATLSPDGHTLFYNDSDASGEEMRIYRRDLDGGAAQELCRLPGRTVGFLSVSRAGGRLLFANRRVESAADGEKKQSYTIMTLATTGGEPQVLYRTSDPNITDGPKWSADGRWVLFSRATIDGYSIPAEGGEPQALGIGPMHYLYPNSAHPDGKQILWTDEDGGGQLWVLKNLFGGTKAARN